MTFEGYLRVGRDGGYATFGGLAKVGEFLLAFVLQRVHVAARRLRSRLETEFPRPWEEKEGRKERGRKRPLTRARAGSGDAIRGRKEQGTGCVFQAIFCELKMLLWRRTRAFILVLDSVAGSRMQHVKITLSLAKGFYFKSTVFGA